MGFPHSELLVKPGTFLNISESIYLHFRNFHSQSENDKNESKHETGTSVYKLNCEYLTEIRNDVYVVVNFLFQLIFIFPLFWGMVMYANEFKTKEKQKLTEIKN